MEKRWRILGILMVLVLAVEVSAKSLVDYVNPMIGMAIHKEGGTAPIVGPPHAMTSSLPLPPSSGAMARLTLQPALNTSRE